MRRAFATITKFILKKDYSLLYSKLDHLYNSTEFEIEAKNTRLLEDMLIIAEDHRFNNHIGFDIIAIIRALRNRMLYNKVEGASTIEQQLVRTITCQYKKTYTRKIKEILLATTIRDIIPKKDIPLLYLKNAYFGITGYGYEKTLSKFSVTQDIPIRADVAAEIVSRIKYPDSNENYKRSIQISTRKAYLLKRYKKLKKNI